MFAQVLISVLGRTFTRVLGRIFTWVLERVLLIRIFPQVSEGFLERFTLRFSEGILEGFLLGFLDGFSEGFSLGFILPPPPPQLMWLSGRPMLLVAEVRGLIPAKHRGWSRR
jgi:hypothetical protein